MNPATYCLDDIADRIDPILFALKLPWCYGAPMLREGGVQIVAREDVRDGDHLLILHTYGSGLSEGEYAIVSDCWGNIIPERVFYFSDTGDVWEPERAIGTGTARYGRNSGYSFSDRLIFRVDQNHS